MPEPQRIARNVHRGLHDGGVAQADYEKALYWAFGPGWRIQRMRYWYRTWNLWHGDLFRLKKNSRLYVMMKRIGAAYAKNR